MDVRHASPEVDGAKVRELRKLAGLSITTLAQRVGISGSYLSQIERGRRPTISPATYVKICEELDVDRQVLMRTVATRPDAPEGGLAA